MRQAIPALDKPLNHVALLRQSLQILTTDEPGIVLDLMVGFSKRGNLILARPHAEKGDLRELPTEDIHIYEHVPPIDITHQPWASQLEQQINGHTYRLTYGTDSKRVASCLQF